MLESILKINGREKMRLKTTVEQPERTKQMNVAQKDEKNILVDLQENILKHMSNRDERFWEKILMIIKEAKFKIDSDKVKLAFAGKMKAGKSTLVNMMLGEDLAKVGVKSTTHIITEFHYDNENPRVEFISKEGRIIDQFKLDEAGKAQAQSKMEDDEDKNCYFVRIYCKDIEILKKFILVDIPGAGDADENLNKYTEEYLTRNEVSTIIWVHRTQGGWKDDEEKFVKTLIDLKKHLYFVFNQTDTQTAEEDYLKEFKKYHPDYEPDRLSVQKVEKPIFEKFREKELAKSEDKDGNLVFVKPLYNGKSQEWIDKKVKDAFEREQQKYDELFPKQEKLKNKFKDRVSYIKKKNARAILDLLPEEIQIEIEKLRNVAEDKRKKLRDRFFKISREKLLSAINSVRELEVKLKHDFKRCNEAVKTEIENEKSYDTVRKRYLKPFFSKDVVPLVTNNFDNKFKALEKDVILFGQEGKDSFQLLGLDSFQKIILFKELVLLEAEHEHYSSPESFQAHSSQLLNELKLLSILIVLDCLKNFISKHNEIWQDYLEIKDYMVKECLEKSGIDYRRAELLNKNENFKLSHLYKEWAETTLALCKKQILSDESETESESRILKQLKKAFASEEGDKFCLRIKQNFPMIYRLKLESCNRNEIKEILLTNPATTDKWFSKVSSLLNKNINDFNDFFVECINLFSVFDMSAISGKNKLQLGINFLPEEKQ